MLSSLAPRPWLVPLCKGPSLRLVRRAPVSSSGIDPLIQRVQSGDERAFHELFLRHRGDVSRLVFRMLGPVAEIEDVVQDTFVHVYRSVHSFKGDAKFSTWLYRLATNVVRMHLRAKRSRPRVVTDQVPEEALAEGRHQELPDEAANRQARARLLYAALDVLSDKKRTVLVLHDLEGVSAEEISTIVGAPVLTVRTRLFYARRELAEALAKEPVFERQATDAGSDPGSVRTTDAGSDPGSARTSDAGTP